MSNYTDLPEFKLLQAISQLAEDDLLYFWKRYKFAKKNDKKFRIDKIVNTQMKQDYGLAKQGKLINKQFSKNWLNASRLFEGKSFDELVKLGFFKDKEKQDEDNN